MRLLSYLAHQYGIVSSTTYYLNQWEIFLVVYSKLAINFNMPIKVLTD
jgi:hypothetical protein